MSGEAPSEIAQKLVDSGTITEREKEIYFTWDTEWSSNSPEDKAIHDKVEGLVKQWQDGKPPPLPGDRPKIETDIPDDKPKKPKDDGMPPPLNTSGDSGSDVAVSTEALRKFSKNLQVLEELVTTEYKSVKTVAVLPGTFGAGVHISTAIQKGLRGDTLNFLQSVSDTFTFLRADIETLITDYDSTEEWNKLTVQQLNTVFNDAFSNIGNYSDYGNSSSEDNGGTGGGGDGEKDDKGGGKDDDS